MVNVPVFCLIVPNIILNFVGIELLSALLLEPMKIVHIGDRGECWGYDQSIFIHDILVFITNNVLLFLFNQLFIKFFNF